MFIKVLGDRALIIAEKFYQLRDLADTDFVEVKGGGFNSPNPLYHGAFVN